MLSISDLTLGYKEQIEPVVDSISFELAEGEIGCLLGPSGCGKTTLLRAIAGFHAPLAGSITVSNKLLSDHNKCVPASNRDIGMVFQDFALFPHMTVSENIAFGLSHLNHTERQNRISECLELVELKKHSNKYPHQLSGGQQQRVALARAIAPRPSMLLLDEPFSSLDIDLRVQLASDVRALIKSIGVTAIVVTHDQHEAFTLADKIAVLNNGSIHQFGTAYDVYHQPKTPFVAKFIGESVFLPGELKNNKRINTILGEFEIASCANAEIASKEDFKNCRVLLRPDDIEHDDESEFKAKIVQKVFRGASILYTLEHIQNEDRQMLLCLAPSHHDHQVGEYLGIRLSLDHLIVFPNHSISS